MDDLIHRARALLSFMGEEDVALQLQNSGVTNEAAFLAVKAAVTIETMGNN